MTEHQEEGFVYKKDVVISFFNKKYCLQELLDMDDITFKKTYKLYEDYMSIFRNDIPNYVEEFDLMSLMAFMERTVLERRIIKLENN